MRFESSILVTGRCRWFLKVSITLSPSCIVRMPLHELQRASSYLPGDREVQLGYVWPSEESDVYTEAMRALSESLTSLQGRHEAVHPFERAHTASSHRMPSP